MSLEVVSPCQNDPPSQGEAEGWLYKSGRRCSARSKRTGEQCQRPAMKNRTVCMHHGGKSLTGRNNPRFTTGRYSKYLPKHLANGFDEAMGDERLLDLSANVALMDVRMNELLGKLNDNETMQAWNELGALLGPLSQAVKTGKREKAQELTEKLLIAWQAVYEDAGVWKEIYEVSELRRKLAESEKKRLVDMDLMVSADRLYLLVSFIQDIILRHVTDASTRSSIAYELRTVLDKQVSGRTGSVTEE